VSPPGGGEKNVAFMDISGEPGPEVGEFPGGGEENAIFTAIGGKPSSEFLREKAQGSMENVSSIGDDVSGQSSLTLDANEIYSSSDTTTKELSSRSTQTASPVTCTSSFPLPGMVLGAPAPSLIGPEDGEPPGGGEKGAVSMAISGKPLNGGEEDAVSMAISGEPGQEMGEPPSGGEVGVVSMAISGESGPGYLREKAMGP
jgi:hypothetical protein